MKLALHLTLAIACAFVAPCVAAQNIFPESTDPRWAPLEETFLVPFEGELPKLAPPKTARLWQPYLKMDSGAKICDEALAIQTEIFIGRRSAPNNQVLQIEGYTQVSLVELYILQNDDPEMQSWTGPEVEAEKIYHDRDGQPYPFGQLLKFTDRPNDIFFHLRGPGSWRGDSGGYYRFDAKNMSWAELRAQLSDTAKMIEYNPIKTDKTSLQNWAIIYNGIKAFAQEKSLILNEDFVLSNLHLLWKDSDNLYFIQGQRGSRTPYTHQIFDGSISHKDYGAQKVCDIALFDNRTDIRYDRIGYFRDGRDLDAVADPEILDAPLRRYFERVAQMVGNGHGQGGSNRSYSINIRQGQGLRQGFLTRPWAYTNPPITGGYSKDTAEKLRRWSYQDAWSRHVYLDALSRYDAARSDAADYLSSAYSGPVPRAEDYAQNAMTAITRRHFWFDVNGLWRAGKFGETNPNIPSIYEGTISIAHYETVLEKARADAALAALNGIPQRNSYRPIATLHDYLTAAFWHDDLFSAYIEGGYDVNAPNHFGKTPLMVAAHLDFQPRVSALIEAGADIHITIPNKVGAQLNRFPSRPRTALDYALENGSWDTIYALMDVGARRAQGSEKIMSTKDLLLLNPNLSDYGRAYIAGELAFRSP